MTQLAQVLADGPLTVRALQPGDGVALIAGRDEEFERFLGPGSPDPDPAAAICLDGTVIGWIDYDDHRTWLEPNEVNVGYNIFAPHRGKGHGTAALRLLSGYLARQVPPLTPTLLIDPANAASLALAAKAGFVPAGIVDGEPLFKPA